MKGFVGTKGSGGEIGLNPGLPFGSLIMNDALYAPVTFCAQAYIYTFSKNFHHLIISHGVPTQLAMV